MRYAVKNSGAYVYFNVVGFVMLMEEIVYMKCMLKVIFVLLLSVYGLNIKVLFSEIDVTDFSAFLYAATKKVDELFVYMYNYIYGVVLMVLRFFMVYGLYGCLDMVYFFFVNNIM